MFHEFMCLQVSEEEKKKKKKKGKYPHWVIYIAYVVVAIASLVSATFTVFYGLTFGEEKSQKWIMTMMISFWQDVLISQPLKVFAAATFFALVIKNPDKVRVYRRGWHRGNSFMGGVAYIVT
jgi:polycystin 1L2